MKRWLCPLAIIALTVGAQTGRGQVPPGGDIGPGDGGAVLRTPGMDAPSPASRTATPDANLKSLWNSQPNPFSPSVAPSAGTRVAQLPSNQVDLIKEFEITDQQGPWAILVMSYSGPEAPQLAREFVVEMRTTFKLNAYVFNYGAEEKRKEYERVQKVRQEYAAALKTIPGKSEIMPTRVRAIKIDEHTGVLIANNYKSRDDAFEALKRLRKLDISKIDKDFSKRVKLDAVVGILEQKDKQSKSGVRVGGAEIVLQNPFNRAFPVRNPAISEEQAAAAEPVDINLLRTLNAQEPLSLLQVKKPFTLVIKQFNTQQVVVRSKKEEENFIDRFSKGFYLDGPSAKEKEYTDHAATHAHSLAEAFRKSGLPEVYALHTKYCSFVTVGGYDSLQDPRMSQMQDNLESRFRVDAYRPIGLLERPAPMAVPH